MYVCEIKALVLKLDTILIHGKPLFSYQCEIKHLQDNFFHSILHHDVSEYKLFADIRQSPSNIHKLWAKCFIPCPFYILSQWLYKTVADWHVEISYLKLQYYYSCIFHVLYFIAFWNGVSSLSNNLLNSFTWGSSISV